jgi:peptide/nickel transport system substrate-binding protein
MLLACGGVADKPAVSGNGTVVVATTGDADILFPPLVASTAGRQATELIYDGLADVGLDLNTIGDASFRPQLATTWQWSSDSLSIAFHLTPSAKWHDGRPLRSDDVKFTFALYTDSLLGSSAREQLTNIDSVTTPDSLTATFWFHHRYPLQFFDATNQMAILPKHIFGGIKAGSLRKIASSIKPVGTGRYRFANWKRGESLELISDSANFRGTAKIHRVIWTVTPSAASAATKLLAGEADIYDTMRPENVAEAATHPDVRIVSSPGTDYVFLRFNLRDPKHQTSPHPLFASRELRRALSMAVDRRAMVRNVFDSLASTGIGPTLRAYPTTDTTTIEELPYDTLRAGYILDSLGWRPSREDGIRHKNGRPLHFSLLVPASSTNRHRMAVLLQEQFRKVGVSIVIDELEFATFQSRESTRDFDAELGTWHLGASAGAVKETWTSTAARSKGGLNYGWYMNPSFDAYVDSATTATDPRASRRYYSHAYSIANQDVPAIWLYEPRMVIGIHKRIHITHIRPDAWWSSLADWYIPAAERIDRDRSR